MFLLVVGALALSGPAAAGPVGGAAGFEDDDGDLADGGAIGIDWNSFAPVTWSAPPPAPFRQADKTALGWHFHGIEDAQATTSDSGFAGGTKQDNDCASVITAKAPNKDDLKRAYLASKVGADGHVYLTLAWVRIPQNTTSPSAHIGFEFNKATSGACPAASDGLVKRTAGDMLIVYDFEGGATDMPAITLRRWITSGACEVGSSTAPCWGPAVNLTALIPPAAEAKVNTTSTAVDALGPGGTETLGINEFGEAGIDLTNAGVFPTTSCESFGKVYAVSRSSGNSGTAQMKDLVGPGDFRLQNCGSIVVKKVTNPSPDPSDTTFNFTAGGGLSPASFGLKNGQTRTFADLTPGNGYSVAESVPAGWNLDSATCDDGSPVSNIDVSAGETVTCTFTNRRTVDARISLAPLTAVNGVNQAHTVTATVEQNTGSGFTAAPDGTTVHFSLVNNTANATFVGGNACTTTGGTCSIQINSSSAGSVDIHATTTFSVLGQSLTRATGTGAPNSADANKRYVDAKIALSPLTAVNGVNQAHTVTATVQQDTGSGFVSAPNGTTVNFSLLNNAAGASFVGPSSCTTTSGSCSVQINSTSAGSVDIHATTTFSVLGQSLTRATGTGAPNSADANKRYVDAKIALSPLTAVNEVNHAHTVTATVQQDTGSGFVSAPNGTTVNFSLLNNAAGASFVGPSSCTTTGGSCSVQINSTSTGSVDIHATTTFSVLGQSLTRATGTGAPNSADANKRYVDARIAVAPLEATNPVGAEHTVTATVEQDTGSGFVSAPNGTTVNFSLLNNAAGASFVGPSSCTTTSGSCSVKIVSSQAGSTDIHATTTFSVLGQSLTRATGTGAPNGADAKKTWVPPEETPCPAGSFTFRYTNDDPVNGDLLIVYDQFPAPNDNSYGVNAVGWPNGHKFNDLVGSDHAGITLKDGGGVTRLDFNVDYISTKSGTPSGYGSLGPFGGDGKVNVGTLTANDITFDSSLARNLNQTGYFVAGSQTATTLPPNTNGANLFADSPPTMNTTDDYTLKTPNPWTANYTNPEDGSMVNGWNFHDTYFVTIKRSKLNAIGFNASTWSVGPNADSLHNSPAKPCPVGSGADLAVTKREIKDKQVKITIANNAAADAFLTQLRFTWPQATNGNLVQIKLDGDTLWQGSVGGGSTDSLGNPVGVPPLVADQNKRKINHNSSDVLAFIFANNVAALSNPAYDGTAWFGSFELDLGLPAP